MDRAVFDRMAELDSRHWWFVARRRILSDLIEREAWPPRRRPYPGDRVRYGHNFGMLGRFGHVDALEIDDSARELASTRLGRPVGNAPLPELSGVPDRHYHLIALLDVLEHIEGDRAALASIKHKLAPGGRVLLTVPANQWMWSAHDLAHHHHRRYSKAGLRDVIEGAGLKIELLTHFNTLLFPLAAAARIAGKITRKQESDDNLPPGPLNGLFTSVFGLERHLVGRVPMPAGVSLVALLS
jgi:SAM-dependent methyltransferase